MKAYTDIEQSKKLAEILPIESADTHYSTWVISNGEFVVSPNYGNTIKIMQEDYGNQIIPCWSLAAMFDHLREMDCFPNIEVDEHGVAMSVFYYDDDEVGITHPVHDIRVKAESFIDACYELVLKLRERKIL